MTGRRLRPAAPGVLARQRLTWSTIILGTPRPERIDALFNDLGHPRRPEGP
jgi:hypothetical protein